MRWIHEDTLRREGFRRIAGLDEVGRGSLAGPVVAAVVILDRSARLPGVRDSKLLSEDQRRSQFGRIALSAMAYGFGVVEAETVDRINVLEASRQAMVAAIGSLAEPPDALLIDAVRLPDVDLPQRSLVHGDRRCLSIAAASILAKVFRDEIMKELDGVFPGYRFRFNKGYGTEEHLRALTFLGPTPLHRLSFSGVQPPLFPEED
ncbi:MAG TPA: ribonuclease HII [Candidatus Polarisedimenticolia bacterium]|nr:ribonuclease HII [Candidatus Polarisedimenticolia bacterium]